MALLADTAIASVRLGLSAVHWRLGRTVGMPLRCGGEMPVGGFL
jgi:hypothetical protein